MQCDNCKDLTIKDNEELCLKYDMFFYGEKPCYACIIKADKGIKINGKYCADNCKHLDYGICDARGCAEKVIIWVVDDNTDRCERTEWCKKFKVNDKNKTTYGKLRGKNN